MNERMIELREQAGDFATETYSKYTMATFDTNKSIETLFEEKFAELIVRECMWKIMLRKEEAIDNDWHVDEAMSAAISDISEQFGVKQ